MVERVERAFRQMGCLFFNRLSDPDYANDLAAVEMLKGLSVTERNELHLAVSMRSFRAEALSAFVGHVVENRAAEARRDL
jgi:hypothetical protein